VKKTVISRFQISSEIIRLLFWCFKVWC